MLNRLLRRIPQKEEASPKILLIDDDQDIRTVTSLVLLTSGLGAVTEAGNGREGLEAARQQRPDVILLDVRLPDIGGETVLQLLKTDPWTSDIPVILFTGCAGEMKRLRTLPVSDIVLKPFEPLGLCGAIHRALTMPSVAPAARQPQACGAMRAALV